MDTAAVPTEDETAGLIPAGWTAKELRDDGGCADLEIEIGVTETDAVDQVKVQLEMLPEKNSNKNDDEREVMVPSWQEKIVLWKCCKKVCFSEISTNGQFYRN